MEKLTITIALEKGSITARCEEFSVCAIGDDLKDALETLQEKIADKVLEMESHNDFIKQMYGDFEQWLEEARYTRFHEKLVDAFCREYPSYDRANPLIHLLIPSIDWDGGENYERWCNAEMNAYSGLIRNGKNDPYWVKFVQAICAVQYTNLAPKDRDAVYKRWKKIGLPVLTEQKMKNLNWSAIESMLF